MRAHRAEDAGATLLTAVVENPLGLRPGRARQGRGRDPGGRGGRRHRGGEADRRGQHLHLLLPPQHSGADAAPAQPGQRPGRVLPDRRRRGPEQRRLRGALAGAARLHGGGGGERPGPAGRGRGRAARPHQRALDAPRRHHVGPRAHLRRRRGPPGGRRLPAARGHPARQLRRGGRGRDRAQQRADRHDGRRRRGGGGERLHPGLHRRRGPRSVPTACWSPGPRWRRGRSWARTRWWRDPRPERDRTGRANGPATRHAGAH